MNTSIQDRENLVNSKLLSVKFPPKIYNESDVLNVKPGFHIVVSVVSVVSVVRKKIHRTATILWKPPVQMLNTKETADTTFCTR